jgi:hypothetical protein
MILGDFTTWSSSILGLFGLIGAKMDDLVELDSLDILNFFFGTDDRVKEIS